MSNRCGNCGELLGELFTMNERVERIHWACDEGVSAVTTERKCQDYIAMEQLGDDGTWIKARVYPPDFSGIMLPPAIEVWRAFCEMHNQDPNNCYRLVRVRTDYTESREVVL